MTLNLFGNNAKAPDGGKPGRRKANDRQQTGRKIAHQPSGQARTATENRQVQQVRKTQADNTDVGNRTHVIRLQAMSDKLKTYTECHLCGFRKWCSPDKNQQPICLACKTFGVNPRFTKDKCR